MSYFAAEKKFAAVILRNEFNQASNSDARFPKIEATLLAERRPVLRYNAEGNNRSQSDDTEFFMSVIHFGIRNRNSLKSANEASLKSESRDDLHQFFKKYICSGTKKLSGIRFKLSSTPVGALTNAPFINPCAQAKYVFSAFSFHSTSARYLLHVDAPRPVIFTFCAVAVYDERAEDTAIISTDIFIMMSPSFVDMEQVHIVALKNLGFHRKI